MAKDPLRTRFCEMLGIEFPIISFTHCKDVAVAVINAGGFAVLGEAMHTPDDIASDIKWIRDRVDGKPFGIDLVLDGRRAWTIEINPRYTGSAEVIEMSTGQSLIGLHLEAFGESSSSPPIVATGTGSAVHAKAVLFAGEDIEVTHLPPGDSIWSVADIPHPGTVIPEGRPICSILANKMCGGRWVSEVLDLCFCALCYCSVIRRCAAVIAAL